MLIPQVEAGTGYAFGAPGFTPGFSRVRVTRSLVLCARFCRSLVVLFFLANVFSVLRFTDSDYPFGIFKLFVMQISHISFFFRLYINFIAYFKIQIIA